jgi:uncharacterized protein (DUF433 family)
MQEQKHTRQSAMERIEMNPRVLLGKPVIRGTRIPVSLILNLLAHDYSIERVLQAYPHLIEDDIKAAMEYASTLTDFQETVYAHDSFSS